MIEGEVLNHPLVYDGFVDIDVTGGTTSATFNVFVAVEVVALPAPSTAMTYQVWVPASSGDESVYDVCEAGMSICVNELWI